MQNNYISKQIYYLLHFSDSLIPKAYRLPKIHKENTPFKIIVSTINTALYPIATYIGKIILLNNIPHTNSYVKNSFEFYNLLSEKNINDSDILISLSQCNIVIHKHSIRSSHRWYQQKMDTHTTPHKDHKT